MPAPTLATRLCIAIIGFMPVAFLALAFAGVPLPTTAVGVLAPAWLALTVYACSKPELGRLLATAMVAGLVATFWYDVARFGLMGLGGIPDGIPNIGRLLVGDLGAPTQDVLGLGYFYRYIGDGGGLAFAYAMGRRYSLGSGMAFGAFVCSCLWATLVAFPIAQTLLFPFTPFGMFLTMVGHLIFGGLLGVLLARWTRDERPTALSKRLTLTVHEAPPVRDAGLALHG